MVVMEGTTLAAPAALPTRALSSNNPYRKRAASELSAVQQVVVQGQLRSTDSEKQVVGGHEQQYPPRALDSEKQVVSEPYHQQSFDSEKQVVSGAFQQRSLDSEKQVVTGGEQFDPNNAPIPVESEAAFKSPAGSLPIREADKEVTSSWQTQSRGESAPISMVHHDSNTSQNNLMNDVKGPPPDYDGASRQSQRGSDDLLTTPTSLEPDSPEDLTPRAEDRSAVGQLLSWIPSSPRTQTDQMPPLFQPVVIPQLDVPPQGESVPFARCYSDVLASHDISIRDFTTFLDGLAVAQAPNSALQGLKMFGAGVGFLPLPLTNLAGKGISALATTGSGHSGSRARLYLERAKREYFAPRGLRLSVIKDNDLNSRLQIPTHASHLAPLTKSTVTDSLCTRRLEAIAPYVAPLRFNVPEQDNSISGVHKMARKHLEHRFKDQTRKLAKLRDDQWEKGGPHAGDWDARYSTKLLEIRQTQNGLARSVGKSAEYGEYLQVLQEKQRELQILVQERQVEMQNYGRRKGVEAEMEEVTWSRKLKWIVLENM